jgi:DNA-binding PadR family transcriptional regulator
VSRLFGHGDLRLWLLKLLEENPRHGYDIISALEEQFLGLYSPSPGTVYPRLASLEQEGLIEVAAEEEGRKVYSLTGAGRAELAERTEEVAELGDRLARSARDLARHIRADVKASVRDLRDQMRQAAKEVRRDERREGRAARQDERAARDFEHAAKRAKTQARQARDAGRDVSRELRTAYRALQSDLEGLVSDVVGAARRRHLDAERIDDLREALTAARAAVVKALEGSRSRR